jgi:hypothetical protein
MRKFKRRVPESLQFVYDILDLLGISEFIPETHTAIAVVDAEDCHAIRSYFGVVRRHTVDAARQQERLFVVREIVFHVNL